MNTVATAIIGVINLFATQIKNVVAIAIGKSVCNRIKELLLPQLFLAWSTYWQQHVMNNDTTAIVGVVNLQYWQQQARCFCPSCCAHHQCIKNNT
jgi:hypothetical protein